MQAKVVLFLIVPWVLASASCKSAPSPSDRCEDSSSEAACRQCCKQVSAPGATWVDSECACLPVR
jgi:hypothetical protein